MCTGGPRLHSVNYFPCPLSLPWRNLQGSSPDSRKLRRKRRLNLDVVSFQLLFSPSSLSFLVHFFTSETEEEEEEEEGMKMRSKEREREIGVYRLEA